MRNKIKYINKLFIAIFVIVTLSTTNFSAVVSDNDGAAFITKAEFDSLKNDFQSVLTEYNTNIDSKIESAIAGYLAAVKSETKTTESLDSTFDWTFPIICMNGSEWNDTSSKYYDYELPNIKDVYLEIRGSQQNNPAYLGWNSTSALSANTSNRSTNMTGSLDKGWYDIKVKYTELINLDDEYVNRQVGSSSVKAYKVKNVGKGRHYTEDYAFKGAKDAGHVQQAKTYWGYTGIVGIGVNNTDGNRNTMTASNYNKWTESKWTRSGGDALASDVGWGGQTAHAFALPSDSMTLEQARNWGNWYTSGGTTGHGERKIRPSQNSTTRVNGIEWKGGSNTRQWVYTGSSDAPATSAYGWCFDMKKPKSTTEPFEGYFMWYQNCIALVTFSYDGGYWGFHSWVPHWFWRFKASGTIGTAPSSSEFSKLSAKQISYNDSYGNVHYFDEGLFLLNLSKSSDDTSVKFTAKWDKIDTSLSSGQKIKLKISSTPFNSEHSSSTNLRYQINDGNVEGDQEVLIGDELEINVECNKNTKQLYMMWEPVTSGAYVGLYELSDFAVTVK